ncbi:hypothetical protein OG21DRAFT_521892 [Imleria badia]|nr:hypothetical protein OG21DRAFT_521892 [Imleria badia]
MRLTALILLPLRAPLVDTHTPSLSSIPCALPLTNRHPSTSPMNVKLLIHSIPHNPWAKASFICEQLITQFMFNLNLKHDLYHRLTRDLGVSLNAST